MENGNKVETIKRVRIFVDRHGTSLDRVISHLSLVKTARLHNYIGWERMFTTNFRCRCGIVKVTC